jgi:hypothetical protein
MKPGCEMAPLVGLHRARAVHVLLSSLLVLGSVLMSAAPATAQEVVTNETVIQMVRAGLSEGVILAKIRSSQTKFDTRTDALIALKQAGVSENVMAAILGGGAPPARAAAPPAASAPAGAVVVVPPAASQRGKGPVFHVTGGKQVELIAASGGIETSSMPYNRKTELILAGNKATYRTVERQPVFLSTTEPAEMPLVRLDPGKNDRRAGPAGVLPDSSPGAAAAWRVWVRSHQELWDEAERHRVRLRGGLARFAAGTSGARAADRRSSRLDKYVIRGASCDIERGGGHVRL